MNENSEPQCGFHSDFFDMSEAVKFIVYLFNVYVGHNLLGTAYALL